ncbi:myelin-oligodendrocyte glycoprotein isoform X2 [Oryzias melastigma]|uniref:myelin-oligodendrocyte glycoprotein isoform X2 n=1 Tax=Oryzias melastigma TaxID=30732 RepID=UPI000CF7DC25|nr:myelin-oligodendrocyte glycoprotein isoform X2 [Oryzias melastigma]
MKIISLLVLILFVVKGFPDDLKVLCPPMPVQTEPGQNVVLSCRVEPQINLTGQTVEWTRGTDVVVHRYRSQGDDKTDQHQRFNNRTVLIHQNLEDGNVSLRLNNVTKEDEGIYRICLPNYVRCSNITLIVVPQRDKKTNNRPGSALSPGVIAAIVLGVLGVVGVFGVLAVLFCRRTRSDLQTDSASIALRNMRRTGPSQPSDEGGANPGQVATPLMKEETKSWWRCSRLMTEK